MGSSIREVAKLAGVSPATVSRVMNGTAAVAPETRKRVLDAIAQTGFVPNEVARTLYKKSSKTIGLMIPSILNPFFTQLASCIDDLAGAEGYRLFLCNVGDDLEKERSAMQMLCATHVDGIIFASNNEDIQDALHLCTVPLVALDAQFDSPHVDACIHCDYYSGGRMAAEHLLACGCKNIVCIKGPQQFFSARKRYEGYRDVCRERGIPEQTVDCDYDFLAGMAMTETLLTRFPAVDGIIACNDIVAISIYKILHKKGISVPDRIQLIGFDDIDAATLISPELTTIRQPIREMAEKATNLILHPQSDGPKGQAHIFPIRLMPRQTTKPLQG